MTELKTVRLQMVIEPSLRDEIDRWRKAQDDLPSRSEAIRRIVKDWLEVNGFKEP